MKQCTQDCREWVSRTGIPIPCILLKAVTIERSACALRKKEKYGKRFINYVLK